MLCASSNYMKSIEKSYTQTHFDYMYIYIYNIYIYIYIYVYMSMLWYLSIRFVWCCLICLWCVRNSKDTHSKMTPIFPMLSPWTAIWSHFAKKTSCNFSSWLTKSRNTGAADRKTHARTQSMSSHKSMRASTYHQMARPWSRSDLTKPLSVAFGAQCSIEVVPVIDWWWFLMGLGSSQGTPG